MSFGIGLGAFVNGVAGGINLGRGIRDAKDRMDIRDATKDAAEAADKARGVDVEKRLAGGYQAPGQDGRGMPTWVIDGKSYDDEGKAREAASAGVDPLMSYYVKVGAPRIAQKMIELGKPEQAKAYTDWMENERVKGGMRSWVKAIRAAQTGDETGFIDNLTAAYNNEGYFPDGNTISGAKFIKDDKGGTTGIAVDFRDKDGKTRSQTFNGTGDLLNMGITALSPENAFSFMLKRQEAADKARIEQARDAAKLRTELAVLGVRQGYEVQNSDRENAYRDRRQQKEIDAKGAAADREHANKLDEQTNASLLRQADDLAKAGAEKPENVRAAIAGIHKTLSETDLTFSKLPPEEQVARAARIYVKQRDEADKVRGEGGRASSQPPRTGAVTVYRP